VCNEREIIISNKEKTHRIYRKDYQCYKNKKGKADDVTRGPVTYITIVTLRAKNK